MIESVMTMAETLTLFSVNYFIHSTLLVGLVLLACQFRLLTFDRLGEWLMKSVLLMAFLTALIQTNGWLNVENTPWQFNWEAPSEHQQVVSLTESDKRAETGNRKNQTEPVPWVNQSQQPQHRGLNNLTSQLPVSGWLQIRSVWPWFGCCCGSVVQCGC